MPFSYAQYLGNGSTTTFSVPFPYLLRAHIRLYYGLNFISGGYAQLLVDGADYSWNAGGTQVTLTSPPGSGTQLTIRRETPTTSRLVDWADGSNIIADDLDAAQLQGFYAQQELYDYIDQLSIAPGGNVPDNSITTPKVANRAITSEKLADDVLNVFAGNLSLRSGTVLALRGDNPTAPILFLDGAGNTIGAVRNTGVFDGTGIISVSSAITLRGNDATTPILFLDGSGNTIGTVGNTGTFGGSGIRNSAGSVIVRGNDATAPIRFQDGAGNQVGAISNSSFFLGAGVARSGGQLILRGDSAVAPIRFEDGASNQIALISNTGFFLGSGITNTVGQAVYQGTNATYPHLFKDGAGNNIAGVTNAGAWTALSDQTLKTSIADLDYGLSAINALRPVTYKLLSEVERAEDSDTECPKRLGFVAQDVQQVIPELTLEMGEKLALEQTGIIPVLVKAVQELSEQVKALQAALNAS